jgi:hypothetical protein
MRVNHGTSSVTLEIPHVCASSRLHSITRYWSKRIIEVPVLNFLEYVYRRLWLSGTFTSAFHIYIHELTGPYLGSGAGVSSALVGVRVNRDTGVTLSRISGDVCQEVARRLCSTATTDHDLGTL